MGRIIGGILLIVGTSIGSGMLALPVATAAGGFYHAALFLLLIWAVTMLAAFFLLEANLWFPPNANMISMAKKTLGRYGEVITWLSYCLLLYSLLSAYSAGGTDLLTQLLSAVHVHLPRWVNTLLFVWLLGGLVYGGVLIVDMVNRGLMAVKLLAYVGVVSLVMPSVDVSYLQGGHIQGLLPATLIVVTSFGYSVVIPTLRVYLNSDVKKLRAVIFIGSSVSLVCYLAWVFAVQGSIPATGEGGLVAISQSGEAASALTGALIRFVRSPMIATFAHVFASVCMTTSFLGVGLCLTDFMSDGLRLPRHRMGRIKAVLVTFLPPLLVVIFEPGLFMTGLAYAGIFCVVLLILMPALMVWRGRYIKGLPNTYRVFGGRALVVLELLLAVLLVVCGVVYF